jgi:hypothetical protein
MSAVSSARKDALHPPLLPRFDGGISLISSARKGTEIWIVQKCDTYNHRLCIRSSAHQLVQYWPPQKWTQIQNHMRFNCISNSTWHADNLTATGYGAGRPRFDPRQRQDIFLYSTASTSALEPPQSHIQWVQEAVSPRVKRPGREVDHSPSSAEAKSGGAIRQFLPHIFMACCLIN